MSFTKLPASQPLIWNRRQVVILIRCLFILIRPRSAPTTSFQEVFFCCTARKTEGVNPCVRSTCRCRPCWLPLDSGRGRRASIAGFQASSRRAGRLGTTAPVRFGWEHNCCCLAGWQLGVAAVLQLVGWPVFFGSNVERDGDTSRKWSGRLSLLSSQLHVARGVVLLFGRSFRL